MDEFWKVLAQLVHGLLIANPKRPRLSRLVGTGTAATGGLIGGALVVGLMIWSPAGFSELDDPPRAGAYAMFGALLFGALGGVAMCILSAAIHEITSILKRLGLAMAMLFVGAALLVGCHYIAAETGPERTWNPEWWALVAHGAVASTTAVLLVDFLAVSSGFRCIAVSVVASLSGATAYAAVTWVHLRILGDSGFHWGRGPFVATATALYVASILSALMVSRLGEPGARALLRADSGEDVDSGASSKDRTEHDRDLFRRLNDLMTEVQLREFLDAVGTDCRYYRSQITPLRQLDSALQLEENVFLSTPVQEAAIALAREADGLLAFVGAHFFRETPSDEPRFALHPEQRSAPPPDNEIFRQAADEVMRLIHALEDGYKAWRRAVREHLSV